MTLQTGKWIFEAGWPGSRSAIDFANRDACLADQETTFRIGKSICGAAKPFPDQQMHLPNSDLTSADFF
jgi:hypothetical protein